MPKLDHDRLTRALQAEAAENRPAFSPALYDRILLSLDDAPTAPAPDIAATTTQRRRAWVWWAVAASLLAVAAGGWLASGRFPFGQGGRPQPLVQYAPPEAGGEQGTEPFSGDPELVRLASAAAMQLALLDEDVQSAAAWFADELPIEFAPADSGALDADNDFSAEESSG